MGHLRRGIPESTSVRWRRRMTSQNKKNKQRNNYGWKRCLKDKGKGEKGFTFYTSSERRRLKHETEEVFRTDVSEVSIR